MLQAGMLESLHFLQQFVQLAELPSALQAKDPNSQVTGAQQWISTGLLTSMETSYSDAKNCIWSVEQVWL